MNGKEELMPEYYDPGDAPDLSSGDWPAKFSKVPVCRGRPPLENPKVSTTIRLSRDVIDHFKAGGKGWQTRIDKAFRE